MNGRITVIVTDDMSVFRAGIISLLERENIHAIGEAENGFELLHLLEVDKLNPDLILLDLEMDKMDGNVTLKHLRERHPEKKVIIMSTFNEGSLKNDYKSKGANSFLTKNTPMKEVVETIRRVHYLEDYTNISQKVKSIFTEGEIKVIPLLLAGKSSKEIAVILGLSRKTVDNYRNRLYEKTGTSNASEFSSYCTREGLEFLGNNYKAN